MLNTVLWQGEPITVLCTGEGPDVEVTATPVIVSYWFGITPGLFFDRDGQFGWWYSSNITDVLTAWRVANLLPQAKRLRETAGYDQTLCSLVIQLGTSDGSVKRRQNLADDFGVSADEMTTILETARQVGPTDVELESILAKMQPQLNETEAGLNQHLDRIGRAEAAGIIQLTPRSRELVEVARSLQLSHQRQMKGDEQEIEVAADPEQSVAQLLTDLGVRNLLYPFPDDWGPSHIELATFDRFVKKHCIGRSGYYGSVPLIVTEKHPDDPTAHHTSTTTDSSLTVFSSNFGQTGPPVFDIGDHRLILHSVRYERGGKYWIKLSRRDLPSDLEISDQSDAIDVQVIELRWLAGSLLSLGTEVPPGTRLEVPAITASASSRKRRHRRGDIPL